MKVRIVTDQMGGVMFSAPKMSKVELGRLRKLGVAKLGVFQECAVKCPDGWEKVIVRKPDLRSKPGRPDEIKDRGICVCRLGKDVRRRTPAGHDPDAPEEKRKPFGTEKKPVRGRRKDREYGPGLSPRGIKKFE